MNIVCLKGFFLTKLGGISFVANEPCQAMQLEERVKEVKTM
jgi:hypothetical protein